MKISKYAQTPSTEELFGEMRGKVKYFEDLTTPTTEELTRSDLVETTKITYLD
ncbi:MAG: hypothetical protein V7K26_35230 [Nostoc sp.]|uniref:hypothetical protein n=1 Tax=Nostoc sp. TaxID=1180 RepID=UPI002FF3828C